MLLTVERWRKVWSNDVSEERDYYWEDLGTHHIVLSSDEKTLQIGYKESGVYIFLTDMFDFYIDPHYIRVKAISLQKNEVWNLRLSCPQKCLTGQKGMLE